MRKFPVREKILWILSKSRKALTAYELAKAMAHPSHYASMTVLRQLHRLHAQGLVNRIASPGGKWTWAAK